MGARGQLSRFAALRALPDAHLDALAAAFVERSVPAGHELTRLGATTGGIHLILSGEVSVVVQSGGVARELARHGAGAIIGLLAPYDGAPSSATCRAVGEVRVGTLGRAGFAMLTRARAGVAYAFQRAVAEQVASDYRGLMARAAGAGRPVHVVAACAGA